jgi:hypothetical protein
LQLRTANEFADKARRKTVKLVGGGVVAAVGVTALAINPLVCR